jgi:hypothetical protein
MHMMTATVIRHRPGKMLGRAGRASSALPAVHPLLDAASGHMARSTAHGLLTQGGSEPGDGPRPQGDPGRRRVCGFSGPAVRLRPLTARRRRIAIAAVGSTAGTTRMVVDKLRARGQGRWWRAPLRLPHEAYARASGTSRSWGMDRADCPPRAARLSRVRAALYDCDPRPQVLPSSTGWAA